MLTPEQVASLRMNATAPRMTTGRAKFVNGQYVLDDPTVQPQKKKKGFLLDNLSTGGSLAGALAGGAAGTAILPGVGTIIGGILGGALGGGGGQVAENAIAGDKLGNDVLSESLWGGATSLPFGSVLKLGKAGTVLAKGLGSDAAKLAAKDLVYEAGVKAMPKKAVQALTLSDALKAEPAQAAVERLAASPTIGQKVAGKLSGAADDLAVKQFRLTPTQLSNFKTKFGEDAGQTIRKYGFNSAEDIAQKGINPLQDQFGNLVKNAGDISTDTIKKNFDAEISKLKGANSSTNRAIGDQLQSEVDGLLSKYGKTIPSNELNGVRREFDSLVNYTNRAADPNKYGVNKRVADVLRETLQDADPSGSLESVGQEISKLKQLSENVAKQGELGRGGLPIGLMQALSGVAGGTMGGAPGALAGYAVTSATNSPVGRRALMNISDKTISKLASRAPKAIGQTLPQEVLRIGGLGAARNAVSGQSSDLNMAGNTTVPMNTTTATPTNVPIAANMPESYTQDTQMSNPLGYSSTELAQAMMRAYADGNTTAAKQLEGMYQLASDWEQSQAKAAAPQQPGFTKPTAQVYSQANTGLQSVGQLADLLQSDPGTISKAAIPGQSLPGIGSLESRALGTSQYNSIANNILNSIARINTGANMPAEEKTFYQQTYLPQPGDSQATINNKLQTLVSFFGPLANYQSSSNAGDLASALQAAGY